MTMQNIPLYEGIINLEDFTPVESPQSRRRVMAIGVNPSGHLSMNERFRSVLKNRSVDFRISKDKKTIYIKDEEDGQYPFPKSGSIKDIELVRSLSKAGLKIPCRYIMKYSEKQKLWVGEYSESQFGDKSRLEIEWEQLKKSGSKRGKKSGK